MRKKTEKFRYFFKIQKQKPKNFAKIRGKNGNLPEKVR